MLSRLFLVLLTAGLLAGGNAQADGLVALSDHELAAQDAREGVLLNLSLLNNMTRTAGGTLVPDSQCTASITANPCRMGLEIAQAGTWFMAKEFYGSLQIKDLRMDSGFLPATATGFQNYERFKDKDGASATCLLSGNSTNCNPAGMVAIQTSYPGSNDAAPSVYDDVLSFMNIGRTWLEFTSGTTEGFMNDTTTNSAFGVRLSDSSALNAPAHMRFRGTAHVFGF